MGQQHNAQAERSSAGCEAAEEAPGRQYSQYWSKFHSIGPINISLPIIFDLTVLYMAELYFPKLKGGNE